MTRASLTLGLVLVAAPLGAQQSDTAGALPFRGGQWASQFGFDGNFISVGALRFRSPTSAWVLDLALDVHKYNYERKPGGGLEGSESDGTDAFGALQLGVRGYRPVATRVNAFTGAGVLGQMSVLRYPFLDTPALGTQRGGAAGLYGELGATWMVARNLGLGAVAQLQATYSWTSVEQPSFAEPDRLSATGYGVSLGRARLVATVYF